MYDNIYTLIFLICNIIKKRKIIIPLRLRGMQWTKKAPMSGCLRKGNNVNKKGCG